MTDKKSNVNGELSDFISQLVTTENKLKTVKEREKFFAKFIAKNASHYDNNPKYALLWVKTPPMK